MRFSTRFMLALSVFAFFCTKANGPVFGSAPGYKTKNVIIAVMDGVRYSETFGDPARALIPNLAALAKEGTLYTNFYNTGVTITRQGHSTIATGTWQKVYNGGPRQTMPTLSEYARNELGWPQSKTWVIFGKDRYAYAAYSSFPSYGERYAPNFSINVGEGKPADDEKVLARVFQVMDTDKPQMMLINFGVTDHEAHTDKWDLYTEAIRHCNAMLSMLWERVQYTPGYQNETTVFFMNDHGRHNNRNNEIKNGFKEHGDDCEGCRHVMMLALGPDIRRGAVIDRKALLVDIAPTVAELLGFQTPLAEGEVLTDCLIEPRGLNKKLAKTPEAERALRLVKLADRDPLKALADASLKRDPSTLPPSPGVEILLRGMLSAAAVTGDKRCLDFVETWAGEHLKEGRENAHAARILIELAAKGAHPDYLAAAKECAEKCLEEQGPPSAMNEDKTAAALRAGFLARLARVTGERRFAEGAKALFGLKDQTEARLFGEWRALDLRAPPPACKKPRTQGKGGPVTIPESVRLTGLLDASVSTPTDRVVRLACDIRQAACTRGIPEIGAPWDDPTVSALNLYAIPLLSEIRKLNPLEWLQPPDPKNPSKNPGRFLNKPEEFYEGAYPWGFDLLKYEIDENGHFGDGSPMSDGAALLLYAINRDALKASGLRPQAAQEPQGPPQGCTRVLIEFGGGERAEWKGSVSVKEGRLVSIKPYLFEAGDTLQESKQTFKSLTDHGWDGLSLCIDGRDSSTVTVKCTPTGISFTLGELAVKKKIEVNGTKKNMIRASLGQ